MDDYFLLCEFTKNLSILYVEDDPNFQKEMASLLGYFFDNIGLARNGVDAIKQYQTRLEENKTFDLVITDIVMPKVDGIKMSKEIYKLNPEQIAFLKEFNIFCLI